MIRIIPCCVLVNKKLYNEIAGSTFFLTYREKHHGSEKEKRRHEEEVSNRTREGACIFPGFLKLATVHSFLTKIAFK